MDRTSTASQGSVPTTSAIVPGDDGGSGVVDPSEVLENQAACSWPTLFSGSPREVLSRLVRDDPLEIRARVASRLRAEALLLDGDRVHLRALAGIARAAGTYRGRPELGSWIDGAVAEAVEALVREEHELARSMPTHREEGVAAREADVAAGSRGTILAAESSAFTSLASPLGLDPGAVRRACAAFDVLPFADRHAFCRLVLEASDLDGAARDAGVSASEIARRARRALDAILASALGAPGLGAPGLGAPGLGAPGLGAQAEAEKARKR